MMSPSSLLCSVLLIMLPCDYHCCAPGPGGGQQRPVSNVTDAELVTMARQLAEAGQCRQANVGGPPGSRVVKRQAPGGQCGVQQVGGDHVHGGILTKCGGIMTMCMVVS